MDRRSFLRRSLGTVLGLGLAGRLPTAAADEGWIYVDGPAPAPPFLPGWRSAPLVASGGLCAPVTPYYRLTNLVQVNEVLPSFNADRGGITFAPPKEDS